MIPAAPRSQSGMRFGAVGAPEFSNSPCQCGRLQVEPDVGRLADAGCEGGIYDSLVRLRGWYPPPIPKVSTGRTIFCRSSSLLRDALSRQRQALSAPFHLLRQRRAQEFSDDRGHHHSVPFRGVRRLAGATRGDCPMRLLRGIARRALFRR